MKFERSQQVSDFNALSGAETIGVVMSNIASEKQVAFIQTLLAERDYSGAVDFTALSTADASALIGDLLNAPRKAGATVALEVGMYRTADGNIYRVQLSRELGKPYAKRLNTAGGFDYEQGAIRKLTAGDKMTLEDAKAFGVETGLCCVCGAFLTDPKSVTAGIGPVCAGRV